MKTILYAFALVLIAAGPAAALTYLKSDDTVILNDGTQLTGTVVFQAETMVVIMVDGVEKHVSTNDIKSITLDPDVTGMVEHRKGDEPKVKKPQDKEEPKETPEADDEKPAEKPKEKPAPEKEPEETVEPKPQPVEDPPAENAEKKEKAEGPE